MESGRTCFGSAAWRTRVWFCLIPMIVFVSGCEAKDGVNVGVDLSELNWQTCAIILLALLVNPGNLVSGISQQLGKIPGIDKLLRLFKLVNSSDTTPGTLTPAETLEALVAIVNRLPPSKLRDELAALLAKAATAPEVPNGQ